jgi:Uma2 family endonuclease
MAEGVLHQLITSEIQRQLRRFFADADRVAFVGVNTFLYWVQFHPEITVAPDVYVMDGVSPDAAPDNWKLWKRGAVPSLVIEVVSKNPAYDGEGARQAELPAYKDYTTIHEIYDALGVPEVILFDPEADHPSSKRVRWQVYRRIAGQGLVKVEVANGDRVYSEQLGCWLRMVGADSSMRVHLATGDERNELFPTKAEALAARAAAAEAEVARLRREIEELGSKKRRRR